MERIAGGGLLRRIIACAAHPGEFAQTLDAEAAQNRQHIIIKPERRHRKIAEQAQHFLTCKGRNNRARSPVV